MFAGRETRCLVVNIVLNYESGSEYSIPDGDGRNDSWGEYSYQIGPEVRDLGTEAHFEFGSRAGVWRLARLFEREEVQISVGAAAVALERNPEVVDWIAEAGHDLIAHGWRWTENSTMTKEEERDDLYRGVELFQKLTGSHPPGWYVRSFPSIHTRELLVEEGGFLYDSDSCNDELPYYADVPRDAVSRRAVFEGVQRRPVPAQPDVLGAAALLREPPGRRRLPLRGGGGGRRRENDDRRDPRALERPGRADLGPT